VAFWRKVNLAIADAVTQSGLHTWGRVTRDHALGEIAQYDWANGRFDHRAGTLIVPTHGAYAVEFTDLHFWKHEIDRLWPEGPAETTNPGGHS
jgi:hypothetical protein